MKFSIDKKTKTVVFTIESVLDQIPLWTAKANEPMDFTEARALCKKILREIGYDSVGRAKIGKRFVGGKK